MNEENTMQEALYQRAAVGGLITGPLLLKNTLKDKKTSLEQKLAEVNEALELIEKNPEFARFVEAYAKALRC